MKDSLKNKNLLVIVFEIIIIILGIIGITFATSRLLNDRTTTLLTADEYNLDYEGDTSITVNNIEPISDNLVNINTRDNVIRTEFKVRGVNTNKEDNLIYDIMLNEMNIDCSLLNKYTKWRLYKNELLISEGSLDPSFDGAVLSDSLRLTNIQENLPKYNQDYDNYVLIFWISESCDNLETCELINQSDIVNSNISMNVFIALYTGPKKAYERIPNYDNSCANKPELGDNLTPVTYKNGTWQVADISNSNKDNLWYDYNNARWANAIILNNNEELTVGTTINENDVLAWYVWIPRYRYKLWNSLTDITDSYNAYENGINIIFENGLNSITNDDVDKYLTHPAFSNNLKGFWISKYEISKNDENYKFIKNTDSYRNDSIDNYQNIITNLKNTYNLADNYETHMINNLEWGAVSYLTHSKYGLCKHDGCDAIGINTTYISGANKQDTTTRNVYGVFDMAGASGEYVLGTSKGRGYATNEIILPNNNMWYDSLSIISERDYLIRGGLDKGLFYFGDIRMDQTENSTRSIIITK